jgi:hypothetical protein
VYRGTRSEGPRSQAKGRLFAVGPKNFSEGFCERLEILWGTANRRREAKQMTRSAQGAERAPKQCPIPEAEMIKTFARIASDWSCGGDVRKRLLERPTVTSEKENRQCRLPYLTDQQYYRGAALRRLLGVVDSS